MRETYVEDQKTLEDLYKLNSESRKELEDINSKIGSRVEEMSAQQVLNDSLKAMRESQMDSTVSTMQASITQMQSAVAQTQFQLDSLVTMVDPEHLKTLENNLLEVQSQFSRLDSTMADLQMNVTDQLMSSGESINTLERHARVQDSANYDILSQLVLLENKIISLTNAFNELMAMPPQDVPRPATQPTVIETTPTSTSTSTQAKLEPEVYKQHYIDALSSYQNKEYLAAIDHFQMLVRNDASNDLADNAQYWIGESYYGLEDYNAAIAAFNKVLTFKESNKADAAQFKIGYCYLNLGDKARGYAELQRVIDNFPDSSYHDRVRQILNSR